MAYEELSFPSVQVAAAALARRIAVSLRRAVRARGEASLALSGGRTPRSVFPHLAAEAIPWERVAVTLTDERWVDVDDAASNEGMVRRHLFSVVAGRPRWVGLKTAAATPAEALGRVAEDLETLSWPLDTTFLGMGEDGHVASLFPDDPGWREATGRCVPVPASAGREARLSLTLSALLDSRQILILLSGTEKIAVYEKAKRCDPGGDVPMARVLHQNQAPVTMFLVR